MKGIEKVAGDLFRECETEIGKLQNPALRSQSRTILRETAKRYRVLGRDLRATHQRMEPALPALLGQAVFRRHNLNAKAITSLKRVSLEIDGGVPELVRNIEASIQEADAFIATMEKAE